jgi:hypothetical protein
MATRFFIWKATKNIYILSTLRNAHATFGWALCICAWVAIKYGWEAYEDNFDEDDDGWVFSLIMYIVIILIYVFLEVNHRWGYLWTTHPCPDCRRCSLP